MNQTFSAPGQFYKGNLHTHSTNSDGKKSPEEVIDIYSSNGWDFVSLTDHFLPVSHFRPGEEGFIKVTDTTDLRSQDFTTIYGAEVHAPALSTGDLWNLVAVGLPLDFAELTPEEQGIDIARRAFDAGAFMGVAHPAWYTLTIEETLPLLPYMHAVEIHNQGCATVNRANSWYFADELLTRGHKLSAFATDDAHYYEVRSSINDSLGGWVQVKAENLEPDTLVAALKASNYYSSTGPEIENISWDGEELKITSTPVERYLVTASGARAEAIIGPNLTEATFEATKPDGERKSWAEDSYFRVTALAEDGTAAWSQPFFRDESAFSSI